MISDTAIERIEEYLKIMKLGLEHEVCDVECDEAAKDCLTILNEEKAKWVKGNHPPLDEPGEYGVRLKGQGIPDVHLTCVWNGRMWYGKFDNDSVLGYFKIEFPEWEL